MYADYGGPMSETPIVQKGLAALPEPVKGAVITVSDRCVSGEREDLSGPLAQRLLAEHDVVVEKVDLVPDGVVQYIRKYGLYRTVEHPASTTSMTARVAREQSLRKENDGD